MRAVLQRVSEARVQVGGETVGQIGPGLLVLLGVAANDDATDAVYIAGKIADLRVFEASVTDGPELSLLETGGAVLVVSQFTLLGDARKGRRPSWSAAAIPETARDLYESVVARLRERGIETQTGIFQAKMAVSSVNDGPFTILLDSKKAF